MRKIELVFMDGYNEVRDLSNQTEIFSTFGLKDEDVDEIVNIWNGSDHENYKKKISDIYFYLDNKCEFEVMREVINNLTNYIELISKQVLYDLVKQNPVVKSRELLAQYIDNTEFHLSDCGHFMIDNYNTRIRFLIKEFSHEQKG